MEGAEEVESENLPEDGSPSWVFLLHKTEGRLQPPRRSTANVLLREMPSLSPQTAACGPRSVPRLFILWSMR